MTLFPIIQPVIPATNTVQYPLYKEVAWDFENNVPVFKNGNPVIVSGREAVAAWAFRALHVARGRYEIYTHDYGNDVENLIGLPYTAELKRAEAMRYVKECLLCNPYITGVNGIDVSIVSDALTVGATISTIYGEEEIHV